VSLGERNETRDFVERLPPHDDGADSENGK